MAKSVALGELDLAAKVGRRHFVGFVADDQIPTTIRCRQLCLDVLVAGKLVQSRNHEIGFEKPVAGARRLQTVVRQYVERQLKLLVQFILPLLREATGANHQAALQVTSRDQLLH